MKIIVRLHPSAGSGWKICVYSQFFFTPNKSKTDSDRRVFFLFLFNFFLFVKRHSRNSGNILQTKQNRYLFCSTNIFG